MTTIIEAVRQYLRGCPFLAGERLNVDFLPADEGSYSVDVVPVKGIVKTYVDGSTVRQYLFALSSREMYGAEIRQQLDNLGFYEKFAAWLESKARAGEFPDLGVGRRAIRLEALTCGYVFAQDEDRARYQIQLRLEYYE